MKIKQFFIPRHRENRAIDNSYFFVVYDSASKEAVAFDPGWDQPIDRFLEQEGLSLTAIFNTHHHLDHVGANIKLQKKYHCRIFGSEYDKERIPGLTDTLACNQKVQIAGLTLNTIDLKAHTLGLLGYYVPQLGALFPGDAIFSVGCGRLFEGTPEQLYNSFQTIAELPIDTMIYCSHEYTQKNIVFAKTIDPENQELLAYEKKVLGLLQQQQPTIPCALKTELKINPYFLANEKRLQQLHKIHDPVELIGHWRRLKDKF